MKQPDTFLTNTTTPSGRAQGAAKNNPGDNTGSGMDKEIYNDPAYAIIAMADSYKEGGLSDADETTLASDLRDSIEELAGLKVTDPSTPANSVDDWDVAESGYVVGDLVMQNGYQYVLYYATGATGNEPGTLAGKPYWKKVPRLDLLMDHEDNGEPVPMGLHPMSDRAGAKFNQNIEYGRYRVGGNGGQFKQFYAVHLDGTQVTGDATLEAIFDPGGADEYWNIDMIAPEELGTRTLLDLGDYVPVPQSSGGDADTVGELVEDQMQQITGQFASIRFTGDSGTDTGAFSESTIASGVLAAGGSDRTLVTFDSADSPDARTSTTTHGKRFTVASPAVIVGLDL